MLFFIDTIPNIINVVNAAVIIIFFPLFFPLWTFSYFSSLFDFSLIYLFSAFAIFDVKYNGSSSSSISCVGISSISPLPKYHTPSSFCLLYCSMVF